IKAINYKELLSKENIRPKKLSDLIGVAQKEIKKGNYPYALSLMYDAFNLDQMNAIVLLYKGICHFELGETDLAADSFTRAYMLAGEEVLKEQDSKYFDFLKTRIKI